MSGFIMPKITENNNQPIISSNMAAAIIIMPTLVLNKPKSIKVRAIMGNAETAMAVPKNKLNKINWLFELKFSPNNGN